MSNTILLPWYLSRIQPKGKVGLLGFTNNDMFQGDLFDKELENWDINGATWDMGQYDTLICLRCAYFSRYPELFIAKCAEHLNQGGTLWVDWGLGDHWRYSMYKVGWIKNDEWEEAYGNKLHSTFWDERLLRLSPVEEFQQGIIKHGYDPAKKSLTDVIKEEVPAVLTSADIKKHFDLCKTETRTLWSETNPQLYILMEMTKV